nr:sugar ABC transporter permease [uncultured Eisenbergiella sp.]
MERKKKAVRPGKKSRYRRKEITAAYLFIAPQIIGLILFVLVPLIFAVVLCFCSWDFMNTPEFVGGRNFWNVFVFDGDVFYKTLLNTAIFILGIVPLTMLFSLGLALLANQKLRGLSFYKSAFFMPMVTSTVAIAMVWYWMYAPDMGLINYLLGRLGIAGPGWLADPVWARVAVILMSSWSKMGYYFLLFLAGLKGISSVYYEAAEMDGASFWQKFRSITLPMLSPVTFFIFVMLMIDAFNMFDLAYIMTRGGPMFSTYSLVMYIYNQAFQYFDLGSASVASMVLVVFAGSVSAIQFIVSKRLVNYDN